MHGLETYQQRLEAFDDYGSSRSNRSTYGHGVQDAIGTTTATDID
jgi:hypothetical protein